MTETRITDHALLRFLERGGGMDIDGVRQRLAASLRAATTAAADMGGGDYLVLADGLIFVMKNHVLVTVIPEDHHVARGLHARLLSHRDR